VWWLTQTNKQTNKLEIVKQYLSLLGVSPSFSIAHHSFAFLNSREG